jgi:hypothetical protein
VPAAGAGRRGRVSAITAPAAGKPFELVNRIVTVVTPHDIERYRAYGPQERIDAMREDFHRWIRQLHPF